MKQLLTQKGREFEREKKWKHWWKTGDEKEEELEKI